MPFNYIDLLAVLLIAYFLWRGYSMGFWAYVVRLASLLLAIIAAFYLYAPLAELLAKYVSFTARYDRVLAFVGALVVTEALLSYAGKALYTRFPRVFFENVYTRALALIPAGLDAVIVILLLVVATTALPLPTHINATVSDSVTGTLAARGIPHYKPHSIARPKAGYRVRFPNSPPTRVAAGKCAHCPLSLVGPQ